VSYLYLAFCDIVCLWCHILLNIVCFSPHYLHVVWFGCRVPFILGWCRSLPLFRPSLSFIALCVSAGVATILLFLPWSRFCVSWDYVLGF